MSQGLHQLEFQSGSSGLDPSSDKVPKVGQSSLGSDPNQRTLGVARIELKFVSNISVSL